MNGVLLFQFSVSRLVPVPSFATVSLRGYTTFTLRRLSVFINFVVTLRSCPAGLGLLVFRHASRLVLPFLVAGSTTLRSKL